MTRSLMVSRVRGGRSPYCLHNTPTEGICGGGTEEEERVRDKDDEVDRHHGNAERVKRRRSFRERQQLMD